MMKAMRKLVSLLLALTLIIPTATNVFAASDKQHVVTLTGEDVSSKDLQDGDMVIIPMVLSVTTHTPGFYSGNFFFEFEGATDAVEFVEMPAYYKNGKKDTTFDTAPVEAPLPPGKEGFYAVLLREPYRMAESDGFFAELRLNFEVKDAEKLKEEGLTITPIITPGTDNDIFCHDGTENILNYYRGTDDYNLGIPLEDRDVIYKLAAPGRITPVTTVGNVTVDKKGRGTVKVEPNNGKGITAGQAVTITATPENGYKLASNPIVTEPAGIRVDGGTAANTWTFVMPKGNATVFVEFVEKGLEKYTLSGVYSPKLGTVKVNGTTLDLQSGMEITEKSNVIVEATPNQGAKLVSIKYRPGRGNEVDITRTKKFNMPSEDTTLIVEFAPAVVSDIFFTPMENGDATAQVGGQVVQEATEDTMVTIAPVADKDYVVDKITVTGVDSKKTISVDKNRQFKMPAEPVEVTVTFKKGGSGGGGGGGGSTTTYTLTYETNGGNAIAAEKFAKDKEVSLSKVATRAGYTFTGWYSDKDLTNKITSIKMDGNKTVYAGWTEGNTPVDNTGRNGSNVTPSAFNSEDHVKYVSGYEDGTIRPNANITRAEVAAMIYRLLTETRRNEIQATTNKFTDVDASKWFNAAVSSLANGKYIAGYPDGTFGGNKNITRAEFVTMLVNFLDAPVAGGNTFSDVPATHWAANSIKTAVAAGWISGYEDGTFKPGKALTRAEAISVLNRVLNRNPQSKADMAEDMDEFKDNVAGKWYYLDVLEAANDHDYVRNENGTEKWVD